MHELVRGVGFEPTLKRSERLSLPLAEPRTLAPPFRFERKRTDSKSVMLTDYIMEEYKSLCLICVYARTARPHKSWLGINCACPSLLNTSPEANLASDDIDICSDEYHAYITIHQITFLCQEFSLQPLYLLYMGVKTRITDLGVIEEKISDSESNSFSVETSSTYITGTNIIIYNETSIGDPGFEEGSITFSGASFDAILKVNDFGGGRNAICIFHRHSTTDAANVIFSRANSNTASHTAVSNNQDIARLIFAGHDGTDYKDAAEIRAAVDGPVEADESMPGRLEFWTTASGSNTLSEQWRIDDEGTLSSQNGGAVVFPSYTDGTRPAAGVAGRVIFNTDDGQLNIDDGSNWTLPDGTTT